MNETELITAIADLASAVDGYGWNLGEKMSSEYRDHRPSRLGLSKDVAGQFFHDWPDEESMPDGWENLVAGAADVIHRKLLTAFQTTYNNSGMIDLGVIEDFFEQGLPKEETNNGSKLSGV